MKYKYALAKLEDGGLSIKEYADLDKEIFSLLCEEIYPAEKIASAVQAGGSALITVLRSRNLYPPRHYSIKIANAISELFNSEETSIELMFSDMDTIVKTDALPPVIALDEMENETELDELLEDEGEEDFEDKNDLKIITSSIKVADDEMVDIDEEEK